MSNRLPYPFPQPYDPSGQFRNPAKTLPMPQPSNLPVAGWFGADTFLSWTAGVQQSTAQWRSPLFDLRPNLRNLSNNRTNVLPMWVAGGSGSGGRLFIQISGLTLVNNATDNLEVTATESVHINDPRNLAPVTSAEDVTTFFSGGTNSILMVYVPPGEGLPVRFYQLTINFTKFDAAAPQPFRVAAAYY